MDSPRCISETRLQQSELSQLGAGATPRKRKDDMKELKFELPPIPTIGKYATDVWTEHPLMHYFGFRQKRKQDQEVVIRHGKKIKATVADAVHKKLEAERLKQFDEESKLESFLTQDDFVEYLRDSVRSAPVIPLQKSWEHKILSMISKKLKARHPDSYRSLKKDIRARYESVLHETILNFVVVPSSEYVNPYALEIKYPPFAAGPPPWWQTYRLNRHAISRDMRLLHPLVVKTFLKIRELVASQKLFDETEFKKKFQYIKPFELKDMFIHQIKAAGEEIMAKFVPVLTFMYQNPSTLKNVPPEKQNKILECAAHMLKCNALMLVMETMDAVVKVYENYRDILPKILLDTSVEDSTRVAFFPTIGDCMFCLKKIIDEIVNVVQQIPDIKALFMNRAEAHEAPSTFYRINVPPDFLTYITGRFGAVMEEWVEEPRRFVAELQEKFGPILNGEAKARAREFIAGKRNFHEGVHELPYFKEFMDMTYEIPKNEYYDRIRLNNEDVIGGMMDVARLHFSMLLEYLIKFYRRHNYRIIQGYESIRDRLLAEPQTTAELVDLVEYIDDARGRLLLMLKEDITEAIKMFFTLMDQNLLSADEREISILAHTWHKKIQPAFEKSALATEAFIWDFFGVEPVK